MLVLTFYHRNTSIVYALYKLYGKKFILNTKGIIEPHENDNLLLTVYNIQQKPIQQTIIDSGYINNEFNYNRILSTDSIANLKPDTIVHKISIGDPESKDICRLNQINIDKLYKFGHLAPLLQTKELELARHSELVFNSAKHYACFNNSFHHTINKPYNLLFEKLTKTTTIDFHGTSGLIFSSIVNKIPDLTDKKTCKGKWVVIYLEDNHTNLCAIRGGKSIYCTNSEIWHELADYTNPETIDITITQLIAENTNQDIAKIIQEISNINLNNLSSYHDESNDFSLQYQAQQISNSICKLGALLNGIDGIIFTGKIGQNSSKLRELVCNKLEWLGINISNKANAENQTKISKKSSKIQIFTLSSEPETAMLQHLLERI